MVAAIDAPIVRARCCSRDSAIARFAAQKRNRRLRLRRFGETTSMQETTSSRSAAAPSGLDPQNVVVTEPVRGSAFPVHLMYVEAIDGLYAPIGLRTPAG